MMETAAADQGHEANKEVGLEDDTIKVNPDEEFDFDIDGPEDNLEALGVFESTDDGLTYQTEGNDALDDAHTYSTQDQGAQEAADELYEDEVAGQDQDQHNLEVSIFDASVTTEVVDQTLQADALVDQTENENAQQAEEAQYGESEKYQDEIDFEETTEELRNFADAGQQDEGLIQSTTISTESVEYSHPEQDHFEDGAHDGDASAQQTAEVQAKDETEPPVEDSYVDEATENEAITAEPRSEEITQDKSFEHDPDIVGTVATEVTTGTADDFEDADDQSAEVSKHSEEHPRVRVSYGTAEFYLFAMSADADPDDYFFENADILDQPLSQFLPRLRQVISEDLQASDELLVKVDGMGIEFGEATTKDFLDQTTFGQVLELYERLVKLDDDSFEPPELYVYLETRPNCLHRLTELANDAKEGKGLSQVAFYYEGTSDLAAVEEESNDYDEGPQGLESDDVSLIDPNDQVVGDVSASQETEQPYNPFRLSESQQQAINASHSDLVEGEVANEPLSVDVDDGHPAYEVNNQASFSGEVQDDLELEATEALRETSADRTQQDTDMLPGDDDEYLAAEGVVVESESQHYAEEGVSGREEVAGTEANAEPGNEHSQEDDVPTDGENLSSLEFSGCTASSEICDCASCMSGQPASTGTAGNALVESAVKPEISDRRLVGHALTDVHQALVATADWSSNLLPTASTQDHNKHKESTSADFNTQDYNAAENDDYLDIGATEEEPAESAGTPGPTSHNSSATATLDGEGHGHGDDASANEALEDASHLVETPLQAGVGSPEIDTDEIHWNDDDEIGNEEVDIANQNQTDLSPSSLSAKRGRQADEDDVGLGDDSIAKRRRT
ncbi:hypothetical protein Daus18300_001355 [Diaporthe australafricana]|uniref:Uncharacterized protein n=1 Tax=Diaporthe australafricana TaxID=127596 RepID=A0ABR3XXK0_9PEZI